MAELTRRTFLTHTSVGVTAGALAGGLTALPRLRSAQATAGMPTAVAMKSEGLIAHLRDASTGEVAVMVGNREIICRDRSLAARLLDAAHTSPVE
jgi:hypothetical protein